MRSPIGPITLAACSDGLVSVWFGEVAAVADGGTHADVECVLHHLDNGERALNEYFRGRRTDFDDLVLALTGTPFQQRVWSLVRAIPYGQTATYGGLARRLGRPRSARAVGGASNRNPLPILIPCHRVIGANGSLTGYRGGLAIKAWLLRHESRHRGVAARR